MAPKKDRYEHGKSAATYPIGLRTCAETLRVARTAIQGALYPRRHQDDRRCHEPAGAHRAQVQEGSAARLTRGPCVAPSLVGCEYLLRQPLRKADWIVYAKRPFGGLGAVLAYLSRYAIASPTAA
jgi:hypothetical protein